MLTLTGGTEVNPSSFGFLRSQNADGTIVIDGAHIDLTSTSGTADDPLRALSGDIRLQNGAQVRITSMNGTGLVTDGTLTVAGEETGLEINRLDALNGSIVATDSGSITSNTISAGFGTFANVADIQFSSGATSSTTTFILGGTVSGAVGTGSVMGSQSVLTTSFLSLGGVGAAQAGGTGSLTVEDNATVEVTDSIDFWTSTSSITVNGGTLETKQLFEDTGVTGTISISDPAGDSALTVGTGDGSSTFVGTIQDAAGGPGSLKKVGTGTFTLTGANTFTGGVVFEGGIVAVDADANLGDSSGPLTFDGGDLRFESSFDLSASRAITLNSGGGTIRTQSFNTTISQAIAGVGDLTKEGGGNLTLSGANAFTGDTQINNGVVILANASALQNSTVHINDVNGLDVTTNAINATIGGLAGSGDLDLSSQNVAVGSNGASTTYSGVITGSDTSRLRHVGTGTLTLTGGTLATPSSFGLLQTETAGGEIIVDGAHVNLTSPNGTPDSPLRARNGDITLRNGAEVDTTMANGTVWVQDAKLTITGAGTSLSARRFEVVGATGEMIVQQGGSLLGVIGISPVRVNNNATLTVRSGGTVVRSELSLADTVNGTPGSAIITDSDSALTVDYLDLGGSAGGTGTMTVQNGATVTVNSYTRFYNAASTLEVSKATLTTNRLIQDPGVVGTVSLSDPVGDSALTVGMNNGTSTFDGLIQDAGGGAGSLKKVGTGTLTLTGANTYTGDTLIDAGTLSIQNTYLGDSADVFLLSGATFNLNFVGTDVIDELFIDGLSKHAGTHGAIGSGADFQWSLFTGTGLLQVSTFSGIPGDFDADGDVDGRDFLIWQRNPAVGNLVDWQANYGSPLTAAATTVPEPGGITMIGCVIFLLLSKRVIAS